MEGRPIMTNRNDRIMACLATSIDLWVEQLEHARRSGNPRDLDHLQISLCQASTSLKQLLARRGNTLLG